MYDPSEPFSLRKIALPAFGPSIMLGLMEGAIFPVLALSALHLGADPALAGIIVALISVGQTVGNLPAAALASHVGERRAMIGAAAVALIALAACLLAHSVWLFAAAVFVLGMAGAVFKLARQTFLTEAAPPEVRARAMSTLGGSVRVGMFAGPFLAAGFIHLMGLPGAYWAAILAMAAGGAIAFLVPDLPSRLAPGRPQSSRTVMWRQVHQFGPVFATLGLATGFVSAVRACRQIVIPLWAAHIGLSATDTALIYGLMGAVDMLLFYPAGKIMDIFGRLWITLPCMLIMGTSFALIPLTAGFTSLLFVSLLMGFGNGIGSGLVLTLGADASPSSGRAEFLGLWRVISDTGGGCGPLILSGMTALASLTAGIVTVGGLGYIAAWMFWRWLPHHAGPPSTTSSD